MARLTLDALQKILYNDVEDVRIKPVVPSSAQTNKLLYKNTDNVNQFTSVVSELFTNVNTPLFLQAVVELQFLYGLRISEVLNIERSDVSSSGYIRVKGLKNSNSRIVRPVRYLHFWQSSGSHLLPLCNTYSRFYFYRKYKELGLSMKYEGRSNNSVTHLFRHEVVQDLQRSFDETSTTQKFLGHKNIKNTQRYENKKNK
jgi:site-specific recombinase XerD